MKKRLIKKKVKQLRRKYELIANGILNSVKQQINNQIYIIHSIDVLSDIFTIEFRVLADDLDFIAFGKKQKDYTKEIAVHLFDFDKFHHTSLLRPHKQIKVNILGVPQSFFLIYESIR